MSIGTTAQRNVPYGFCYDGGPRRTRIVKKYFQGNRIVISISVKEILILAAIIGGMIWMRMARETVEATTNEFVKKLRGPSPGRPGFGWRGLIIAFVVGMACCCALGYIIFRLVTLFRGGVNG